MPMDALFLSGLVGELNTAVTGGKIDKIHQPLKDDLVLSVRTGNGAIKLLLSANPNHPRAHLTTLARENPDTPPMFCMFLRKHLTGGRILKVEQPPLERIIIFSLECLDDLGDRVQRKLILEAIGRHSNLILLDAQGRIMDCLRRVDAEMSPKRQVLPNLFYHLPPTQDKLDPTQIGEEEFLNLINAAPAETQAQRWLLAQFGGLSPLICRELVHRVQGRTDSTLSQLGADGARALFAQLKQLLACVANGEVTPSIIFLDQQAKDFSFIKITQYGQQGGAQPFETFSALLDCFYEQREVNDRVRQKGQDLIRWVTNARNRVVRKIAGQEEELLRTENRQQLREYGDLITANLHLMQRGMETLRAQNFYDPAGNEVIIPLNPLRTPQQNAAQYYKEYHKAKIAQQMLAIQLEKGRAELDYLESVLENLALCEGEHDLQAIRQELTDGGLLRAKKGKKEKRVVSKPMEFISSAGLKISVGKNNTQNDLLTCKQAYKSDIWLHAQKIHGAHVILWANGTTPDEQSILEAASLAAWFSKGREAGKVAVDYTQVKYVKKQAGARAGMVHYTTYQTIYVTPDAQMSKQLRVTR